MREREGRVPFSFGHEPDEEQAPRRGGPRPRRRRGWLLVLVLLVLLAGAAVAVWHFQPALLRNALRGTPLTPPPTVTHAYKWRDAQGNWHISDRPPPAGTPYQSIEVRSDENIVPPPQ